MQLTLLSANTPLVSAHLTNSSRAAIKLHKPTHTTILNTSTPSLLHAQVRVAAYHHGHHNNNNGHNAPHYKDCRALRDLKTKQNKHILSTYNKAYALFPKVTLELLGQRAWGKTGGGGFSSDIWGVGKSSHIVVAP